MGVRVMEGSGGMRNRAVLYDSVTEWVFGPIFECVEDAELFLVHVEEEDGRDPRVVPLIDLEHLHREFVGTLP